MMTLKSYIKKIIGIVKKKEINKLSDSEYNYKKNSEIKDNFLTDDLFFCDYIRNSEYLENSKATIFDIGCSEGANEIFKKYNFFNYIGCDALENEISKLNKKNKHENIRYLNYNISPPKNKEQFLEEFKFQYYIKNLDYFNFKKTIAYDFINKYEKNKSDRNKIFDQLDRQKNNNEKKITTDEIIEKEEIKDVNFMKIDIDGYTNDAIYGGKNVISSNKFYGLKIEVNYTDPYANDHFIEAYNYLYKNSFKLYRLTGRQYLHKGYIGKFIYDFPSQNFSGVDQQGDMVFIKDFEIMYNNFKKKIIDKVDIIKYFIFLEILNMNDLAIYLLNKYDLFNIDEKNIYRDIFIKKASKEIYGKFISYEECLKNK